MEISNGCGEATTVFADGSKHVPFSMATENVELMHECSPKHLHVETV